MLVGGLGQGQQALEQAQARREVGVVLRQGSGVGAVQQGITFLAARAALFNEGTLLLLGLVGRLLVALPVGGGIGQLLELRFLLRFEGG
jgi:hypothetical protein